MNRGPAGSHGIRELGAIPHAEGTAREARKPVRCRRSSQLRRRPARMRNGRDANLSSECATTGFSARVQQELEQLRARPANEIRDVLATNRLES